MGFTEAVTEPEAATATPADRRELLLDALAVVVLLFPLLFLQDNDGGLQLEPMAQFAWVAVPAGVLLAREFRFLDRLASWAMPGVALGAVMSFTFALDRTGFVRDAVFFAILPVVHLAAVRLWRQARRRRLLLWLFVGSWAAWLWDGLLLWWGFMDLGSQPRWELMSWHNQTGILSAAFGMFFLGVALLAKRRTAIGTGLLAAMGLAGAWLSSSRAAATLAVVTGLVTVTVAAWSDRSSWRPILGRGAAVALATALVVQAMLLPLPEGTAAPLETRTEAAAGNASQRLNHWEAAAGMFTSRPLTGQGLGSFRQMSVNHTPPDGVLTVAAHNEWLEALGEGGLALGLPLAMVGLLALLALRRAGPAVRSLEDADRPPTERGMVLGLTCMAFLVGAHATFDFDFRYPVVGLMLAIGLAVTARTEPNDDSRAQVVGRSAVLVLLGLVAVLGARAELSAFTDGGAPGWATESHLSRMDVALAEGDHAEARSLAEQMERWNPGNPATPVYAALGELALGRGDARSVVEILPPPPTRLNLYSRTAEHLLRLGYPDEAMKVADVAVGFSPAYRTWGIDGTVTRSWTVRVEALAVMGRCQQVPALLAQATEQFEDFVQPHRRMGELLEAASAACPQEVVAPS